MNGTSSTDFINRAGLELAASYQSGLNIKLPCIYDNPTIKALENLKASFESIHIPTVRPTRESKSEPSFFWKVIKHIPRNITIDNSVHTGWFSTVNQSTNTTTNINNSNVNSNNNTENTKKTKAETEKEKQEAADNRMQKLVGIVAALMFPVTSYFVGSTFGTLSDLRDDYEDLDTLKGIADCAQNEQGHLGSQHYRLEATQFAVLNQQIQTLKEIAENKVTPILQRNTMISLGLRITLAAAALFGLIGSFCKSKPLMSGSAIISVITLWGELAHYAYKTATQKSLDRASLIVQGKINDMLGMLNAIPKTSIDGVAQYAQQIQQQQPFYTNSPQYNYAWYQQPQHG